MHRLACLILVTVIVTVQACDVCDHGYNHPEPHLHRGGAYSYQHSTHESYYTFNNGTHFITITSKTSGDQRPLFELEVKRLVDGGVVERSTLSEAEYAARRADLGLTGTAGAFGLESLINEYEERSRTQEYRRRHVEPSPLRYPSEYYTFYNTTHSTTVTQLSAEGQRPQFQVVTTRRHDNAVLEDVTLSEEEYRMKRISLGLRGPKGAFGMTSLLHGHDSAEDRQAFFADLQRREDNPQGYRYSRHESFYTFYNSTHSTTITKKTSTEKATEFHILIKRLSDDRVVEDTTLTEDEYRIRRARLGLTGPDGAFDMPSLLDTRIQEREDYNEYRRQPQLPAITRYSSEESYYTFYNGTHSTTITRKVASGRHPEFHLIMKRLGDNAIIEDSVLTEDEYASRRAALGLVGSDGAFGMPSLLSRALSKEEQYYADIQRLGRVRPYQGPGRVVTTYSSEEGWYSTSNGTHTMAIRGEKSSDGLKKYSLELVRDRDQAVLNRVKISEDEYERRRQDIDRGMAFDAIFGQPRYHPTPRGQASQREYTSVSERKYSVTRRREEERSHHTPDHRTPQPQPARPEAVEPPYPVGAPQEPSYTSREERKEETFHREISQRCYCVSRSQCSRGNKVYGTLESRQCSPNEVCCKHAPSESEIHPQARRPASEPQVAEDACTCIEYEQCGSENRVLTRAAEARCRYPMVCCKAPTRPRVSPAREEPVYRPEQPEYSPQPETRQPTYRPQQPETQPQYPQYGPGQPESHDRQPGFGPPQPDQGRRQPSQPETRPAQPEAYNQQPQKPNRRRRPRIYQRPVASQSQPDAYAPQAQPQPEPTRPAGSHDGQETFRNIVQHVDGPEKPRQPVDQPLRRLQTAMTALDRQQHTTVHRNTRVMTTDGVGPQSSPRRQQPNGRPLAVPGRVNEHTPTTHSQTGSRDQRVPVSQTQQTPYQSVAAGRDTYDMRDLGMTPHGSSSSRESSSNRQYTYQQRTTDSREIEVDEDDDVYDYYYDTEDQGVESHSSFHNRPLNLPRPQQTRLPSHVSQSQLDTTAASSQQRVYAPSQPQQPDQTVSGSSQRSYTDSTSTRREGYPTIGGPGHSQAPVGGEPVYGAEAPAGANFPSQSVPSGSEMSQYGYTRRTSSRQETTRTSSSGTPLVPGEPVGPSLGSLSGLRHEPVVPGASAQYDSSRTVVQQTGGASSPAVYTVPAGAQSTSSSSRQYTYKSSSSSHGVSAPVAVPAIPVPVGAAPGGSVSRYESSRTVTHGGGVQPAGQYLPGPALTPAGHSSSSYRRSYSSRSSSGVHPGSSVYTYRYTRPVVTSYPVGGGVSRSYSYRRSSSSSSGPSASHYSGRSVVQPTGSSSSYYSSYQSHH